VPGRSAGGSPASLNLERLISDARRRLPSSHKALLEQIGVQDAVVYGWPDGVQGFYETLKATPPTAGDLANALAVWLPDVRVVAYNGVLLEHALDVHDLDQTSIQRAVDNIAWHEYGHALSATRASAATKRDGPRLLALLPPGLRAAIDYPGGYRQMQVFDEVIANVYALIIGRAVQSGDYGMPSFLHPDVCDAFEAVVPWPPHAR
jgi:phage tail protein X